MSRGRKSAYPERPSRAQGYQMPGVALKKPSSEHISGRRKIWIQRSEASSTKGGRETYDKIDHSLCQFGHAPMVLVAFLKRNRNNRVPLHVWGKKGKQAEA